MVAVIIIAPRRVAPRRVRVTIAIVVIVVPGRGSGDDCGREQFISVYGPPVLSTRNPRDAERGRRPGGLRLGLLDPQRDAALFRPAERQQRYTCDRCGRDCSSFNATSMDFLRRIMPTLKRCAPDQPNRPRVR